MLRPPHHRSRRRRGAVAVESAVVYSVMFLLLLGIIIGGMGVFRYQLVAGMAREAARYASVRGGDWYRETNQPSPTQAQIAADLVAPMAAGMDPAKLTVRVQWVNGVTGEVLDWDESSKAPTTPNATGDDVANRVRVTVTYRWNPELYFGGPTDLESTSECPMAY